MTPEEKNLIDEIRNESVDLKLREKAIKRLGEILEETFILDLIPEKTVIQTLEEISMSRGQPSSLKRKAKSLLKAYKI
jgi:hypothetical protein